MTEKFRMYDNLAGHAVTADEEKVFGERGTDFFPAEVMYDTMDEDKTWPAVHHAKHDNSRPPVLTAKGHVRAHTALLQPACPSCAMLEPPLPMPSRTLDALTLCAEHLPVWRVCVLHLPGPARPLAAQRPMRGGPGAVHDR